MENVPESTQVDISSYDLTNKIYHYLDPHLIYIFLSWVKEKKICKDIDIDGCLNSLNESYKNEIVSIENEFTNGNRNVIENFLDRLEVEINEFQNALMEYKVCHTERISGHLEKKTVEALLKWINQKNNEHKKEPFSFSTNIDELILKLGRYYYQKKDYAKSKKYLLLYYLNVAEVIVNITESPKIRTCYWGIIGNVISKNFSDPKANEQWLVKVGEELLVFEEILNEITLCSELFVKLSQTLNKEKLPTREIILQRSWLIHWSLFLMFHFFFYLIEVKNVYPKGSAFSILQDWFVDERNLCVLNLSCPHIIRYYCVYAIFNRNRKDHFDLIINALRYVRIKYSDPFTSFLVSMYIDYDFTIAQKCIAQVKAVCERDMFLHELGNNIEEQCRVIIFETYCRIHKSINIDMIAKKVNLSREMAEKWIVNLIRNAKLDAKIDSEKNCVEITTAPPNLYQQVIDKAQNMVMRTNFLVQNLSKPSDEVAFIKQMKMKNKNDKGKNFKRNKSLNMMFNSTQNSITANK